MARADRTRGRRRGTRRARFRRITDSNCTARQEGLKDTLTVKRWLCEELQSRPVFNSPFAVREFLKIHFAGREYESFMVLFLDVQNRLIEVEEVFRGTLSQTSVYPREIVKSALRQNAASVMFSHNHPSGVAEPSRADEALTQTLKAALCLIDVRVLDHIIVAGPYTLSFAERGLI